LTAVLIHAYRTKVTQVSKAKLHEIAGTQAERVIEIVMGAGCAAWDKNGYFKMKSNKAAKSEDEDRLVRTVMEQVAIQWEAPREIMDSFYAQLEDNCNRKKAGLSTHNKQAPSSAAAPANASPPSTATKRIRSQDPLTNMREMAGNFSDMVEWVQTLEAEREKHRAEAAAHKDEVAKLKAKHEYAVGALRAKLTAVQGENASMKAILKRMKSEMSKLGL
jgi:hypothetical protein